MSEFEVQVTEARLARAPQRPGKRLFGAVAARIRAVLMRPRLLIVGALTGFVVLVGTPHAGWEYGCRHPMHGPSSCHAVAWCAYYGLQGRRVAVPEPGDSCRLITFLRIDWPRLMGG